MEMKENGLRKAKISFSPLLEYLAHIHHESTIMGLWADDLFNLLSTCPSGIKKTEWMDSI